MPEPIYPTISLDTLLRKEWAHNKAPNEALKEAERQGYSVLLDHVLERYSFYKAEYEYFISGGSLVRPFDEE